MCLTQEACLRRNLVHVCPNPARKNSESSPQQRERGPEHKSVLSHSRALGEVRGPGPERWLWTFRFFPRLADMFSLTPGMRQKGTVQVPSSFFYERQSIIHQSEVLQSDSPASSSVWHGNTICSVGYCIHHCSMRELWETSTLSKNVTEDVSWIPSIVNLSISLSVMKLCWITARQTQPMTHRWRFICSDCSASPFVWDDAECRQLLKLSQHVVTKAKRVNLMKDIRHISPENI